MTTLDGRSAQEAGFCSFARTLAASTKASNLFRDNKDSAFS
jgi:hypothetical protein